MLDTIFFLNRIAALSLKERTVSLVRGNHTIWLQITTVKI